MSPAPTRDEIREFIARLALLDGCAEVDSERLELVTLLDSAKASLAAAQVRVTVAFDASQRAAQRAAGVPVDKLGAGIAEQVALARRDSPTRGSQHLGLAKALVHEMPGTLAALTAGELSEWRATLIVQATAVLDPDMRRVADARLAGRLGTLSDKQVRAAAMAVAYELDPRSFVDRAAYAVSRRRVSIRPAPDTMAYLTALLPAAQAVAVFAALNGAAGSAHAAGDPRSRDQVKADTLVERVTGQSSAAAVPVEIGLVMSEGALLAGQHTPAVLLGYGPIPATLARELAVGGAAAGDSADGEAAVWVRRLYVDPVSSSIVDADRRRRFFPAHLRRVIVARDQWCRTPWCGAPIRHIDHVVAHGHGGLTELGNGAGLCERCNQVKEAAGWRSSMTSDELGRAVITTSTPAGLTYSSTAPAWNPALSTPEPRPPQREDPRPRRGRRLRSRQAPSLRVPARQVPSLRVPSRRVPSRQTPSRQTHSRHRERRLSGKTRVPSVASRFFSPSSSHFSPFERMLIDWARPV